MLLWRGYLSFGKKKQYKNNMDEGGLICKKRSRYRAEAALIDFIKRLLLRGNTHPSEEELLLEPEFQTKPCRSCGRPISYNPEWKHIPNYCRECKDGLITRTCKRCGKTFTLPESVQHWPNYCQECRARFRPVEVITRTCRGCGHQFTFPSSVTHWPHFCRECQAKRKAKLT